MPYKILIVDGNPECLHEIHEILREAGYDALKTGSSIYALDIIEKSVAEKNPIDMVIMETEMPAFFGYESCREMKKTYNGIVIGISERPNDSFAEKWRLAGARFFLDKKEITKEFEKFNNIIIQLFRTSEKAY